MMTPCCGISSWRWRFCSTRRRCCCCWPRRRQGVDHGYGQERRSGPCRRMVEAPALDQAHVLETASQGGKARDRKGTEGVNKELAKKKSQTRASTCLAPRSGTIFAHWRTQVWSRRRSLSSGLRHLANYRAGKAVANLDGSRLVVLLRQRRCDIIYDKVGRRPTSA